MPKVCAYPAYALQNTQFGNKPLVVLLVGNGYSGILAYCNHAKEILAWCH